MRACDATSAEHSGAFILSVVTYSPNVVELDFSHWGGIRDRDYLLTLAHKRR
jgi:hypothetical protein